VVPSSGGHLKIIDDEGRVVTFTSSTPSEYRGAKNLRARIRRHERDRAARGASHGVTAAA
jgi:hypothetical protein